MKNTLMVESQRPGQLQILLRVAREMGMKVSLLDETFNTMNLREENDLWLQLAEKSLAEDWNDPSNDHWDEFFKNAPQL